MKCIMLRDADRFWYYSMSDYYLILSRRIWSFLMLIEVVVQSEAHLIQLIKTISSFDGN